ncbi:amino acid adenylation domain-containing protein [Bradyrhizobium ontarionense]|uniref:Amino acid adenylation domain-containing protein n=1 Tax=Bradyrhizobium ontarionense TaxID=2898149 RepID=A0ABY3RKM3_9BRAD|nr:non-ribosomal peptide synthetase [Bradyrhizobium sp. A19]UFZ08030.1 amino acid adenylation domain-containing protein [Bradyrhizobium sp. A19]
MKQLELEPLSEGQKGLWLFHKLDLKAGVSQTLPICFTIKTVVDISLFRQACEFVLKHSPLLSSVLVEEHGEPFLLRYPDSPLYFACQEMPGASPEEVDAALRQQARIAFGLSEDALVRFHIYSVRPDFYAVLIAINHIVFDGASVPVLLDRLFSAYDALLRGQQPDAPTAVANYRDFVEWEQNYLKSARSRIARDYWMRQFPGPLPALELDIERRRTAAAPQASVSSKKILSASESAQVSGFCARQNTTPAVFFLAVYQLLLKQYSQQRHIIIGMPALGRPKLSFHDVIGYFIDMIPIQSFVDETQTFDSHLMELGLTVVDGIDHGAYPFPLLVNDLKLSGKQNDFPIFQVWYAFHNRSMLQDAVGKYSDSLKNYIELSQDVREEAGFKLELEVFEGQDSLAISLKYDPHRFAAEDIAVMLDHYTALLRALINDPTKKIDEYPCLSDTERHRLLVQWNATTRPYPGDSCIHELIEAQASRTPTAIALVFEQQRLSYAALDQRANQVAHYLHRQGIKPDMLVGLFCERSLDMVIGLLGILKAGAAYVPIDPATPEQRIRYMLEDAAVTWVLSQSQLAPVLPLDGRQVLYLDTGTSTTTTATLADQPTTPLARTLTGLEPTHLAYVIYTSGSTGLPKGVMTEHRALVNRIDWMQRQYPLAGSDAVLQKTPFTFDVSVWEFIWPLMSGARLVIARPQGHLDAHYLIELIQQQAVTIVHFVPSMFSLMLQQDGWRHCTSLRHVFCSGEALPSELPARHYALNKAPLHNLYGPTEAAIDVSCWHCPDEGTTPDTIPIGRPIQNTALYVLDENGQPVPRGVKGELHIGGVGLARGYWRNAELTAAKFIRNPFSDQAGSRLYRTGDYARWRADGVLEYVGRMDDQIKLRGFRVELGEIESHLARHPWVQACAVRVHERGGEQQLVAYVLLTRISSAAEYHAELRQHLRRFLPDYMVPAAFVVLERLPMTPSGKVDRKALPPPDAAAYVKDTYVAPRTPTEKRLAQIWARLLRLEQDQISVNASFFALGGHSLLAMRLVNAIQQQFGVTLTLRTIFENPAVSSLAALLAARQSGIDTLKLEPVARHARLLASFAQQRFWILSRLEGSSSHYNLVVAYRIKGALHRSALIQTLATIVARHESLRTRFTEKNGELFQIVDDAGTFAVITKNVRSNHEIVSLCEHEANHNFDLAAECLIRIHLLAKSPDEHVLLLNLHHSISDGWSFDIFFHELESGYSALRHERTPAFPHLPLQYADFAWWQRQWHKEGRLDAQLAYWKRQLSDPPEEMGLPLDRPRAKVNAHNGATARFALSHTLTAQLQDFSRREGVTVYMTLLTAFAVIMHRYSQKTDIAIGTPVANRNRQEIENLIGLFVNTLVLRIDLTGNPSIRELMLRIKATAIAAYEHQDVPFEHVVEALQPQRRLNQSPLFQVLFVLQGALPELDFGDLSIAPVEFETTHAKFDLTLNLQETSTGLQGVVEYNSDIFAAETISAFIGHYENSLRQVIARPDLQLAALDILGASERTQLLAGWNATTRPYPGDSCIHELIEAQASRTPTAIALVFEQQRLSYAALDQRANQVAHYLHRQGIKPDMLVGLFCERSLDMVIGLLGILKAGAAYVPIDPATPEQRIRYMLEDAAVTWVLSQSQLAPVLPLDGRQVLYLDTGTSTTTTATLADQPTTPLARTLTGLEPTHLAYVIYTSGSTGLPKGVMTEHRALVNRIDWMQRQYPLAGSDAVLQKTPFTFDVSVWEFIWPLMSGARLVIARPQGHLDAHYLIELIQQQAVTIVHFVPSMFSLMLQQDGWRHCTSLRHVFCSGEALPSELPARHYALNKAPLHNLYGPTEAAIEVSYWHCPDEGTTPDTIPIGRPIQNTALYVLDENGQPVPRGVKGELHIGGVGLARGYWRNAELTAAKFIRNPFSDQAGSRLYRTGDYARWRADGVLEYVGRMDDQIKLRGFRVELGEIESHLARHPWVQACAVRVHERGGEQQLVAYVLLTRISSAAEYHAELRQHLRRFLPDYMVPAAFVVLETLPMMPSGKVDRKALPPPDAAAYVKDTYVAPRTPTEKRLAQIWAKLLGLSAADIGTSANFFRLGGHSLKAISMQAAIQDDFGIQISLMDIMEKSTIAGIAQCTEQTLSRGQQLVQESIPSQPVQEHYAVSELQKAHWDMIKMDPTSSKYNFNVNYELGGANFSAELFIRAFTAVVNRHASLRAYFRFVDDEMRMVVLETCDRTLDFIRLTDKDEHEQRKLREQLLWQQNTQPFKLFEPHAQWWGCLLQYDDKRYELFFSIHHIFFDGLSLKVLSEEIAELSQAYEECRTPALGASLQYQDFAAWHNALLRNEATRRVPQDFWREQLRGTPARVPFKYDFPVKDFSARSAKVRVVIDEHKTQALKQRAQEKDLPLFIIFLAAYNVLLAKMTGHMDIAFGGPVLGRGHQDLNRIVGYFANAVIFRTILDPLETVDTLLDRLYRKEVEILQHQSYPFSLCLEDVGIASHKDILAAWLNMTQLFGEDDLIKDSSTYHTADVRDALYPFSTYIYAYANGIEINQFYYLDLFRQETIEAAVALLLNIIDQIAESGQRLIKDL